MNVIYIVSRLLKGDGPVNQALNLATALRTNQVNMIVVTLFPEVDGKSSLDDYKRNGVEVIQLNSSPLELVAMIKKVKVLISKYDAKIVHTFSFFPDIVGYFVRKETNVITVQRSEFPYLWERRGELARKIAGKIDRFIAKNVNVVACSSSLAKIIEGKYGVKCSFVRNGVNTDRFKPLDKDERIGLRKKMNLPLDKSIFIIVGSLNKRKNVRYILDAAKKNHCKEDLFLVLGDGELGESLREDFRDVANIRFIGQQNNPLLYYQIADYYVSASRSEGFPNSVLESIACGLPVIISDIPQHREFFEYGNIGGLFELDNPETIENVLRDCKKWNHDQISKKCLEIAVNSLSKYATASNFVDIYNNLMK